MAESDDIQIEEQFTQKAMNKALFTRLMHYVQPYRKKFLLNVVFTICATISALLGPKFIQVAIDRYLTSFDSAQIAYRGILIISLSYLGNLLIGWFLSVTQVKTAIAIGQGAMNDLRLAVFRHIQSLSLNFFDKTHQGRIISRADSDIGSLDHVLTWGANQLISSSLTLIGAVAFMLQYDWRLCLAVVVVLPFVAIATRAFHIRVMPAFRRMVEQGSRLTASFAEGISGVRVVQAFAREEVNLNQFGVLHDAYGERVRAAAKIFHTYLPFVGLLSGLGTAIILGYGGHLAMQREITVGELAAFVLYLGMFFGPIQTMGDLYNAVLSTAASAERIFQLLDTQPQIMDRPDAQSLARIDGHIVFEHVSFRYDSTPIDRWILDDVCFEARSGETIALVGTTGSGKTSIVSLVARFYEPQQGRILIDGVDLKSTTVSSLRSQIGIVTQENFLFSGTVMDNLKFGRPSATNEEVVDAARTLGMHDIILRMQDGYDTKVSERGGNFSAGERQLLTFVRAMVARPRVLILDEATSAVDSQTEQLIQHALEKLFEKRTSFVVAHRLSTVRTAHLILVLQGGRIVERGNHDQLIQHGGHYSKLYQEFVRK
jgi:ATP-binding cassette, subfamily B, multidrug efflux pump